MSFLGNLFGNFFAALMRAIDGITVTVRVAGAPRLVAHREVHQTMPGATPVFNYTIQAPASFGDPSAVKFSFYATVAIPGQPAVAQPSIDMQPGEEKEVVSNVPAGATVDCWFTESDQAGNESVPGPHLTFVAKDDIAPAAPSGSPVVTAHVEVIQVTPTPDQPTPANPLPPTPTPPAGS